MDPYERDDSVSSKSGHSPSPVRRLSRSPSPHIRRSPVRQSRSRSRSRSRSVSCSSGSRSPSDSPTRSSASSSMSSSEEEEYRYKQKLFKEKKIINRDAKDHNLLLERRLNRLLCTLYNERIKLANTELKNTRTKQEEQYLISRELELAKKRPRSPTPEKERNLSPRGEPSPPRKQHRSRSPPNKIESRIPTRRERSPSPKRHRERTPPRRQRSPLPSRIDREPRRERERSPPRPHNRSGLDRYQPPSISSSAQSKRRESNRRRNEKRNNRRHRKEKQYPHHEQYENEQRFQQQQQLQQQQQQQLETQNPRESLVFDISPKNKQEGGRIVTLTKTLSTTTDK